MNWTANDIVLFINTLTNAFAFLPMAHFYRRGDVFTSMLILCSFLASCAMHLTETKHGLVPWRMKEYSSFFLVLDRFFAGALFIVGLFYLFHLPELPLATILLFLFGLLNSGLGELARYPYIYLFHHTIWHACAFLALNQVIE